MRASIRARRSKHRGREGELTLSTEDEIAQAVARLGPSPLTEPSVATHLRPLFTRTLTKEGIYLASHSLGRPLDAVERDLAEALSLWQHSLSGAWDTWLAEEARYRSQLAALLGVAQSGGLDGGDRPGGASSVVPRTSAGQALRTVLNMLPEKARVVTTAGEFDSISMLLAQYARIGRIRLELVPANEAGLFDAGKIAEAVQQAAAAGRPFALAVVSHVFFATGQLLSSLSELADECHQHGTRLLIDSYHSLGALPVDVHALGCDYMIGGCYKYLRGGPGAAFLYLAPQVLNAGLQPLDTGWFALEQGASPHNPGWPQLRAGGDALLEGVPAVLTWYQARSGLAFTRAVGVERLRAYGLSQLQALQDMLAEQGIASTGGDQNHGAFLTLQAASVEAAAKVVASLGEQGIVANARGVRVRLCPDCLTTQAEFEAAAESLGRSKALLNG